MTKRILLTGFEPFGTHRLNSSWEAIRNLDGTTAAGAALCSVLLPVEYHQGPAQLAEAIETYRPDIAISFGLAAGDTVRLERYARNGHGGKCDNAGLVPPQPHLEPGGEAVRESLLPLESIRKSVESSGVAVDYSADAGGYVCNAVFYRLAEIGRRAKMQCGFIHLPPLGELFPQSRLEHIVRLCIAECLSVT